MTKKNISILVIFALLFTTLSSNFAFAAEGDSVSKSPVQAGIWFETAYAEWQADSDDDQFSAKVRLNGGAWEDVDSELVRKVDAESNAWRLDVLGLRNTGDSIYDLSILNADNIEVYFISGLVPVSFDRQGYAFVPDTETAGGGQATTGGYNADGTVAEGTQIIYLTHENMNQVLTSNRFQNSTTPTIIRVLGQVGIGPDTAREAATVPTATGYTVGSNNSRMYNFRNVRNITVEGVGPDAYIEGWGMTFDGARNVVVRNMTFNHWYDDAVYMNNTWHFWIAHNTFHYGVDRWMGGGGNQMPGSDNDHIKGDGSTDVGNASSLWTISYNKYIEGGKTALIGGGAGAAIGHGTIHHNWFYDCDERHPRVRNGWIHVFNNLYDNVGGDPDSADKEYGYGYAIGAGHRANIVSEGNTFNNVYRPYIISGEFSCHAAGPNSDGNSNTLSNDAPGIIITSYFDRAAEFTGRDLVPDYLNDWSKGINTGWTLSDPDPVTGFDWSRLPNYYAQWYFPETELTWAEGAPQFTNSRRNSGNTITYQFVPFHEAQGWQTDGQTGSTYGGPNGSFAKRPAINDTLSSIGVQSASASSERVKELAGINTNRDVNVGVPYVILSGDTIAAQGEDVRYLISVANMEKLATATLWFEVEDTYLAGKECQGLGGFELIDEILWTQDGDKWIGRATIGNLSGGVDVTDTLAIFEMVYSAKEALGITEATLTRIELSGYDEDNKAVFIDSVILKDTVETEIVQWFSPYDINRDGKVDQLDLTTAQLYYAAREEDSDWADSKIADVNADGCVDIEDLIVILSNIAW